MGSVIPLKKSASSAYLELKVLLNDKLLKVENTIEMISLFEPLGGRLSSIVLIIGIAGAGLSTVFPIVLIAPWLIADYKGTSRDIRTTQSRILILIG